MNLPCKVRVGYLRFSATVPPSLKVSVHAIPSAEVVTFEGNSRSIDRAAILGRVDLSPLHASAGHYESSTARRDTRKLNTEALHQSWYQAYRIFKRKHPDKSDVWCSRQMAKTHNEPGPRAETILRQMKKSIV